MQTKKKKTAPLGAWAKTLLCGVVGGVLFQWLQLPLPWMIGPLLLVAISQTMGLQLQLPKVLRNGGQWVIGTALGMTFTAAVLQELWTYWPLVVVSLLAAIVLGIGCCMVMGRLTGLPFNTTFFATAMGGSTEMALISERLGGRTEYVAAAHSMRILWIVLTIPFLFKFWGVGNPVAVLTQTGVVHITHLLLILACSLGLGWLVNRWGIPNGWLIGPIVAGAMFAVEGSLLTRMPASVVNAGQLLIGCALGIKFNRQFFSAAPRYLLISSAITIATMLAMAGVAAVLSAVQGMDIFTLLLATSPGGVAEMTMTARALDFSVPVVTVFHVCRVIFMATAIGVVYRWLAPRFGGS